MNTAAQRQEHLKTIAVANALAGSIVDPPVKVPPAKHGFKMHVLGKQT
jgi:hypothetical protein